MWNVFPEIRPNPKNKIITFERRRSPFLLSPPLLAGCRPSKPLLLPFTIPNTSKMLLFYRFSILYTYWYFLTFKTKMKTWTDSSKIKMKKKQNRTTYVWCMLIHKICKIFEQWTWYSCLLPFNQILCFSTLKWDAGKKCKTTKSRSLNNYEN